MTVSRCTATTHERVHPWGGMNDSKAQHIATLTYHDMSDSKCRHPEHILVFFYVIHYYISYTYLSVYIANSNYYHMRGRAKLVGGVAKQNYFDHFC